MKPFEDELRRALGRREPPAGFTERVLARVRQESDARNPVSTAPGVQPARRIRWAGWSLFGPRLRLGLAGVAVALVLAVSLSVWRQHREEQERIAGAAARAQVMQALRITSAKLSRVRAKVASVTDDSRNERLED
ncbi:MAG TPA: hypothetical protein VMT20_14290 [Terriglobia bacterium]|nr:hypothetical protein [Terriglobia bacterium]